MKVDLKGIMPALVTPFRENKRLDKTALRNLVKFNLKKGVDGFYVGGSSSEAFLLPLEKRKRILKIVLEGVEDINKNIIFHVGCIGTDMAIQLAKHAEEYEGVDAISSVPPFYYDFSLEEVKNYYLEIINSVNLPMVIYNYPDISDISINQPGIKELLNHEKVVGVKHTSHNLYQLERMKTQHKNLTVFNGYDEMFLAGLSMGADGGIGSTYNFMAEKFIKIKKAYEAKELSSAQKLQSEANDVIEVLSEIGVYQGIKYILKLIGIDCQNSLSPFKPLTDREKLYLEKIAETKLQII